MSAPPLTYVVATEAQVAAAAENAPEHRAGFESLGFVRLPSMLCRHAKPDGFEELAAGYEPLAALRFRLHAGTPDTVLVAPDRSAFARLSWFWDSPCAHLVTVLEDGRLVETRMAWTVDPPWPVKVQRYYRLTDRTKEQLYDAVPGRSVRPVATADPAELWRAHQQHVGQQISQHIGQRGVPVRAAAHESTEQLCRIAGLGYEATWRSHERVRRTANAVAFVSSLLVIFSLVALFARIDDALVSWALALVVLVAWWWLASRVQWWLRHARWLRVPIRRVA